MNQNNSVIDLADALSPIPSCLKKEGGALTPRAFKKWIDDHHEMKKKIDAMAAEVSVRQDKMRFINEIICEINALTDDKSGLSIAGKDDLIKKLGLATQELGVKIPEGKLEFTPLEFTRLMQNLNLSADGWDKENKTYMQKIEIQNKIIDRLMMILKGIEKAEHQAISTAGRAIRGG